MHYLVYKRDDTYKYENTSSCGKANCFLFRGVCTPWMYESKLLYKQDDIYKHENTSSWESKLFCIQGCLDNGKKIFAFIHPESKESKQTK